MSRPDYNNSNDHDWEDSEGVSWSELDWQAFLKANQAQMDLFLNLYLEKKASDPNAYMAHQWLDHAAQLMGWAGQPTDETSDFSSCDEQLDRLLEGGGRLVPYTIHQHPVFIVTQAFFDYIDETWAKACSKPNMWVPSHFLWRLNSIFQTARFEAIMALASAQLDDYSLAICHFKHGLTYVNQALKALQEIREDRPIVPLVLLQDTQAVLFDIRAIWLRMIEDCRQEAHEKQLPDDDEA